jgi:hypothetical protein
MSLSAPKKVLLWRPENAPHPFPNLYLWDYNAEVIDYNYTNFIVEIFEKEEEKKENGF